MNSENLVQNLKLENENLRQINNELMMKNDELETNNMRLNDTVEWMHAFIWDTIKKTKIQDNSPT
ncbi:hypothetical protein LQZ18_07345 [Lachnospiraceae bacterium ZAX-1]